MFIHIASFEEHAGVIQEDICIRDAFIAKGVASEIDTIPNIVRNSKAGDMVILKSIWGYHVDHRAFIKQLSELRAKGVKLINDYDFILWNIDKGTYIPQIRFLNVIPTAALSFKSAKSPEEIAVIITNAINNFKENKFVIKPTVGASGYLTLIHDIQNNGSAPASILYNNKELDFIIQPYRPLINEGELSVIMIDGNILYAIKRFPGVLVEKKEAVYVDKADIPAFVLEQMCLLKDFFLEKFGKFPQICRADFLENSPYYEVLEIELIDPDLFFRYIPNDVRLEALTLLTNL